MKNKLLMPVLKFLFLTSCVPTEDSKNPNSNTLAVSPLELNIAEKCETHFLGSLWRCPKTEFHLEAGSLSSSSVGFLNTMPVHNKLNYSFHCEFNGPSPRGELSLPGSTSRFEFVPTNAPSIRSIDFVTTPGTKFLLTIDFDPLTFINGSCKWQLINMASYPSSKLISIYSSFLIEHLELANETILAFDHASTLNEKWIVLDGFPNQLAFQIKRDIRLCREKSLLLRQALEQPMRDEQLIIKLIGSAEMNGEFDQNALCPASYVLGGDTPDPCDQTLNILPDDGEIGQIQARIKDSSCLVRDIKAALPQTQKCSLENDDSSICLKALKDQKDIFVGKKRDLIGMKVQDLLGFLRNEISRISPQSFDLVNDLTDMIQELERAGR